MGKELRHLIANREMKNAGCIFTDGPTNRLLPPDCRPPEFTIPRKWCGARIPRKIGVWEEEIAFPIVYDFDRTWGSNSKFHLRERRT